MKFLDYTFDLMSNDDIVFDSELTADKLNVRPGDLFEVVLVDGAVVLQKVVRGGKLSLDPCLAESSLNSKST
jgi:hypothetical protein